MKKLIYILLGSSLFLTGLLLGNRFLKNHDRPVILTERKAMLIATKAYLDRIKVFPENGGFEMSFTRVPKGVFSDFHFRIIEIPERPDGHVDVVVSFGGGEVTINPGRGIENLP